MEQTLKLLTSAVLLLCTNSSQAMVILCLNLGVFLGCYLPIYHKRLLLSAHGYLAHINC